MLASEVVSFSEGIKLLYTTMVAIQLLHTTTRMVTVVSGATPGVLFFPGVD